MKADMRLVHVSLMLLLAGCAAFHAPAVPLARRRCSLWRATMSSSCPVPDELASRGMTSQMWEEYLSTLSEHEVELLRQHQVDVSEAAIGVRALLDSVAEKEQAAARAAAHEDAVKNAVDRAEAEVAMARGAEIAAKQKVASARKATQMAKRVAAKAAAQALAAKTSAEKQAAAAKELTERAAAELAKRELAAATQAASKEAATTVAAAGVVAAQGAVGLLGRLAKGALLTVETVGENGKDMVAARQSRAAQFNEKVQEEKERQKKKVSSGEAVAIAAGMAAAATVEPFAAVAATVVVTAADQITRANVKRRLAQERAEAEAARRQAEEEAARAAEAAAQAEVEAIRLAAAEAQARAEAERRARLAVRWAACTRPYARSHAHAPTRIIGRLCTATTPHLPPAPPLPPRFAAHGLYAGPDLALGVCVLPSILSPRPCAGGG